MVKKLLLILVLNIIVITNIFGSMNLNPSAVAETPETNLEEKFLKIAEENQPVEDEQLINNLSENFQNYLESHSLNVNKDFLNFDDVKVHMNTVTNTYILSLSIDSPDFHEFSSVSVFFNIDHEVETIIESQIYKNEFGNFGVKAIVNGEITAHENLDYSFFQNEKIIKDDEGIITPMVDWGGFLDCMDISAPLAISLGIICGGVCIGTLGTACIHCVGLFLGLSGSSVGTCLGRHW